MSEVIKLQKIELTYKTKYETVYLFHDLNLSFEQNSYTVILGKSGSGKSSILNLISGFLSPSSGQVLVENVNISDYKGSKLSEYRNQKIGYIFQSFNLIMQFTVIENVMAPLLIRGLKKSDAKKRAIELLEQVELKDRMNHFPNELSGGEQQRVAIARALANDPDIILADEPTGNLDEATGNIVLDLLDQIHKDGKTIILVTHNNEIVNRATEVIRMEELSNSSKCM